MIGEHMKFKKIYIEITNICNLHCSFCAKNQRSPAYMSKAQFERILSEVAPYTNYLYFHVLGEPLLHPELSEFLRMAKEAGFYVNMTSNGTLLPNQLPTLKNHIRQLNLSLHSKPMEDGCHSTTYLQDCLKCGDELAMHHTYVSYRFWNQRDGQMDQESKQMLEEIATHYGVTLNAYENIKLAPRRFLHFEEQFAWPSMKLPIISTKGICYGMRNQCAILVDGSVVPCCLDSLGSCTLGNIFETAFAQVLEQPRTLAIREGFQKRIVVEPLCQRCGYRTKFEGENYD